MGGCGTSSKPEVATPPPPVDGAMEVVSQDPRNAVEFPQPPSTSSLEPEVEGLSGNSVKKIYPRGVALSGETFVVRVPETQHIETPASRRFQLEPPRGTAQPLSPPPGPATDVGASSTFIVEEK